MNNLAMRYVVNRAADLGESYYVHDDLMIDKNITDELDRCSGTLFDLVDEHLDARDRNNFDTSNDILDEILSDPLMRILAAYHLNSSLESGRVHEQ
jgi:hypothetical protein